MGIEPSQLRFKNCPPSSKKKTNKLTPKSFWITTIHNHLIRILGKRRNDKSSKNRNHLGTDRNCRGRIRYPIRCHLKYNSVMQSKNKVLLSWTGGTWYWKNQLLSRDYCRLLCLLKTGPSKEKVIYRFSRCPTGRAVARMN